MSDKAQSHNIAKLVEDIRHHMDKGLPLAAKNVFTLSGTPGSGGSEIAAAMAKKAKLTVYDKSILEDVAEMSGMSLEALKMVADNRGDAKDFWLYRLFSSGGDLTHEKLQQQLNSLFYALAHLGNCIIVGRAAHIPLQDVADLRIRIVSGRQGSVAHMMERDALTQADADARYDRLVKSSGRFAWNIYGTRLNEPTSFDIVVNTDSGRDYDYLADMLLGLAARNAKHRASARKTA
ncbi:hypothetical protein FACS1894186_7220 [Alphaproteobacteria bacterium]|nr:hypothetical protein FACS1894186_7220 [Alphaproteobacteria bacterium]